MSNRLTEKVTLHFDLSHCPPDQEFSVGALGLKRRLARHTPETLSRFRETNKALALLSAENQSRVTHFVEDVELPAEVGIHLVTYPNQDPDRIPELALAFIHIPTAAKSVVPLRAPPLGRLTLSFTTTCRFIPALKKGRHDIDIPG